MILGNVCTRRCGFCNIETGKPNQVMEDEPEKVAKVVSSLGIKHAVVTAVARDDLADGGASHFVMTIEAIRRSSPATTIEVLIPDFKGSLQALLKVISVRPEIINHNVETVRRLQESVRPQARYERSLALISRVREYGNGIVAKSGIMLGLGELQEEIQETLRDIRNAGGQVVTIGQYLQPRGGKNLPVAEYVEPERFEYYADYARSLGFDFVVSGPLVRSSYRAEEVPLLRSGHG